MMRKTFLLIITTATVAFITLTGDGPDDHSGSTDLIFARPAIPLPARSRSSTSNTLCAANEQVIFSCALKGSAKLVSLCGSKRLTRDEGYLQYRFGRPGSVELEFPRDRDLSQKRFAYEHYFRPQFDRTEISFENDGYGYTLFDYYDGERRRSVKEMGVSVKAAGGETKEITMRCQSNIKADYGDLSEILSEK